MDKGFLIELIDENDKQIAKGDTKYDIRRFAHGI